MMFQLIEGLPSDVLGIEASGKVTHEDYRDFLIPRAEALMAQGPIKMLYVLGGDFSSYKPEALWDDAGFGAKHWHDFKRIAVVADVPWIRAAIALFRPIFPCEVRLFALSELAAAKEWIAG
jgi:SpoIIAA-like